MPLHPEHPAAHHAQHDVLNIRRICLRHVLHLLNSENIQLGINIDFYVANRRTLDSGFQKIMDRARNPRDYGTCVHGPVCLCADLNSMSSFKGTRAAYRHMANKGGRLPLQADLCETLNINAEEQDRYAFSNIEWMNTQRPPSVVDFFCIPSMDPVRI